ncbi:FMNH2-dependent monooxygenase protein [Striga asiatica]|uniref:FMNH2-dependent monooxygenase protein n=1 Tax=Striga asiatica TaxID=4170 RepID=A0A5A7P1Q9_STRAF|nr:FMNH2-dependent monooxygenase protein [Striga asiatica]
MAGSRRSRPLSEDGAKQTSVVESSKSLDNGRGLQTVAARWESRPEVAGGLASSDVGPVARNSDDPRLALNGGLTVVGSWWLAAGSLLAEWIDLSSSDCFEGLPFASRRRRIGLENIDFLSSKLVSSQPHEASLNPVEILVSAMEERCSCSWKKPRLLPDVLRNLRSRGLLALAAPAVGF